MLCTMGTIEGIILHRRELWMLPLTTLAHFLFSVISSLQLTVHMKRTFSLVYLNFYVMLLSSDPKTSRIEMKY